MQRLNIDRISSKFDARVNRIVANVHDYRMLTPTLAKVVVTFNSVKGVSRQELETAAAQLFEGKMSVISDSFRPVTSSTLPAFVGFLRLNREVKEYAKEEVSKMRVMASNLLMDDQDKSLWEIKSGKLGQYLARQNNEDLSELLEASVVRQYRVPALAAMVTANVGNTKEAGNRVFAAVVDPKTETLRYGYVLSCEGNQVEVVPAPEQAEGEPQDQENITASVDSVVELAYLHGSDSFAELSAPAGDSKTVMTDYYKKIYADFPEFWDRLKEIINQHAVL